VRNVCPNFAVEYNAACRQDLPAAAMHRSRVVLPAPDGPKSTVTDGPEGTSIVA
jgi:hypothetical protein